MALHPLRVRLCPRVERRFKTLAKDHFPKEAYAYLLGRDGVRSVDVTDLWIPSDLDVYTTQYEVAPPPMWSEEVTDYAKEHELDILGSIHSHPWSQKELLGRYRPDHAPSEQDLD